MQSKKIPAAITVALRLARPSLVACLCACGTAAMAQPARPLPDAGSILREAQPAKPAAPSTTDTGLQPIEPGPVTGTSGPEQSFEVSRIAIRGNTLFDTQILHELVAGMEGSTVTLPELHAQIGAISDYYHAHGYVLAHAYLPAQSITDGVVRVEVLEARYDKVGATNSSRVPDRLLQSTLAPLTSGNEVYKPDLDRALLLFSDIPGVVPSATFRPGSAAGTSDLDVSAGATRRLWGHVAADNYGDDYSGEARVSAGLQVANPFGIGDLFSLNLLTSGEDLLLGRADYEVVVNGYGTRLGAAYSQLDYSLGGSLKELDGNGTARVASARLRQPLLRWQTSNLYMTVQVENSQLRDNLDAPGLRNRRSLDDVVATLSGDHRDNLFDAGGVTSASLSWTYGDLSFDDGIAEAADGATAQTAGGFSKWSASIARLQGLNAANTLYLEASGQWSSDNLDSSQKLSVGGPYGVRAYETGALSADNGYQLTAELRHQFAAFQDWEGTLFMDYARVKVNASPWRDGENRADLTGTGVGLNWYGPSGWVARGSLAWRLGSEPDLLADSGSSDMQGWIQVQKQF